MSKVDAWMPLYVAKWQADTTRFTAEQHGIYLLIVMDYWCSGAPPDDDEVLARIAKLTPAQWKKQRPVLEAKFQIGAGVWRHKRVERELAKAKAMQQALSERGKEGAAARWHKDDLSNGGSNATGMQQAMPETMLADAPVPSSLPRSLPSSGPPPSPKAKKNGNGLAQAPFVLPDWIPKEHWDAWVEARTKARHPPTDYAKRLAVMKLENMKEEGHAPAQVLMNAAFNGWTGLFPPKEIR